MSALQQAMQDRGLGQTGLNQQVSPPSGQVTLPPSVPAGPTGMPPMQTQGKPPTSEAELILKAMSQRLSHLSKAEQAQTNLQTTPVM